MKAFEQILLVGVWEAGLLHGFPVQLLRLGLELCAARMRLVFRRACSSRAVETLSAILQEAGSGFATDFMFLMLIGPMDAILNEYKAIRVFVIADDIRIGVIGEEAEVVEGIKKATTRCLALLEEGLHMQVSRNRGAEKGKTVAMGSSSRLRQKLASKMRKIGINTVAKTKNLGVDFAVGTRAGRAVQLGRWAVARGRAKRARRLGGRLASAVVSTSTVPSVVYGVATTGMTDGLMAALRSAVAAAVGKMRGRSVTARLAMDGNDPGARVVVQPIDEWAQAWWASLAGRSEMTDAWKHAAKSVGMAARPNAAVIGGAGSFFASLRRLGWKSPSPDSVITQDGLILFFGDGHPPSGAQAVDPRSLRKWALDEYEKIAMLSSKVTSDINANGADNGYGRAKESGAGTTVRRSTSRDPRGYGGGPDMR